MKTINMINVKKNIIIKNIIVIIMVIILFLRVELAELLNGQANFGYQNPKAPIILLSESHHESHTKSNFSTI